MEGISNRRLTMARVRSISGSGGNLTTSGGGNRPLLEFAFTQRERDSVVSCCALREDIGKRFRKMVAVGSDIVVAFDRFEARDMLVSLSGAVDDQSEDEAQGSLLKDLRGRFESKCNDVFYQ